VPPTAFDRLEDPNNRRLDAWPIVLSSPAVARFCARLE
jgi:hypothetical protein